MSTLTIRLPDDTAQRLKSLAQTRGLSLNKLMEELSAQAIAAFDMETRFRTLAARGDAARVYLDVCYFHPFVDGNARAARLALDHVITRAGLAQHAVEPLFVVARAADDGRGAWGLAYSIEYLLGRPA